MRIVARILESQFRNPTFNTFDISPMRSNWRSLIILAVLSACDHPTSFVVCRAFVQFSPTNVVMHVGDTVTLATAVDGGCLGPTVRNETPNVLEVDPIALRVIGRAVGAGRIHFASGVDSSVAGVATVTVIARAP